MLYLDQPVQVGLSYDNLQNITSNLLTGDITLLNDTDPIPEQNNTFYVGVSDRSERVTGPRPTLHC